MRLFGLMLVNQREKLVKNDIRLHVAGDVSAFSDPLRKAIEETERATEHCSAMQLTICANYGGSEIDPEGGAARCVSPRHDR